MSEKEKEKRPSLLYRVGEDWPAGIVGFISIALEAVSAHACRRALTSIIMMAVITQR